ncbi:D-hexose-6-phosphate mutarotase [Teredinibacter turnerae]|uniref:D-hexose-6-phosphate mutarotase n=1 Tax=Teredinibacter turnerae TaxID=2426 RepID=UPI0005F84A2C|nr:D-hexose-6-phosphate mutarotase [Teredinibacter turnerae]
MPDEPHIVRRGELDVIQIDNAACSAEISLFGGHVLQWQPSGRKPVLWMSDTARYDGSTALRGGVPICWPWFGAVADKGRHGLVRNRNWQVTHFEDTANATFVELEVNLSESENPWPHPNKLVMKVSFGGSLLQSLLVENTSDKPQCFNFAFHNYLRVSNPATVTIPLLGSAFYEDKLTGQQQQLENRDTELLGYLGPLDRIYSSSERIELLDPQYARKICIDKQRSQHWVVWNPGSDAASMDDVHESGEHEFLCVETANTSDIVIEPGEKISMSQTISLENLSQDH